MQMVTGPSLSSDTLRFLPNTTHSHSYSMIVRVNYLLLRIIITTIVIKQNTTQILRICPCPKYHRSCSQTDPIIEPNLDYFSEDQKKYGTKAYGANNA